MSDLISRQETIYTVNKAFDRETPEAPLIRFVRSIAVRAIGDVPSAETFSYGHENDWIPVSKKLPKIGKEVLLSEPNAMFIAEYHGAGDSEGLWLVDGLHHYLADVNGCAWMHLPKPYKEGE